MFKRVETIEDRFQDAAEAIHQREGCSRIEALQKARRDNPTLYKALRST
jgi:hypothetical protein